MVTIVATKANYSNCWRVCSIWNFVQSEFGIWFATPNCGNNSIKSDLHWNKPIELSEICLLRKTKWTNKQTFLRNKKNGNQNYNMYFELFNQVKNGCVYEHFYRFYSLLHVKNATTLFQSFHHATESMSVIFKRLFEKKIQLILILDF